MENNNGTFSYTYSAKQQEEIKNIRQKYLPHEENKMETLRTLDQSAKKPGTIVSLAIGIIGSLILGLGMACVLEWTDYFIFGIVAGVIGIAILSPAYPIYLRITKKQREKLTPQIIQLSNELM